MTPLDEHGLVRLAAAERAALVAFARRRLGERGDDAEDAVQEALVKALRALRGGAAPENGRAWLFTILAHCCADVRAGAARRPTVPVPEGRELPDAAPSVARTVESRAEVAATVASIRALPAAQRAALVGYELGGDTYEELGARHGWSVSATKSLLWRARSRLVEERAGWAAAGGAPLAAWRFLLGRGERPLSALLPHGEKPAGLLAAPWGAEAVGAVAVAALGAAAVGLPASQPPAASAAAPVMERPAPARTLERSGVDGQAWRAAAGAGERARAAAARARAADPAAVVAACAAGAALEGFSVPALARAKRALPTDARQYTQCDVEIDRALVRAGG